ncbi:MAG: hypothetical protein ABEI78_01295 [Candidatus Nanohaloarchaea archaeon]
MDREFEFFAGALISAILVSRLWYIVFGGVSVYLFRSEIHHIYLGILILMFAGFSGFFLNDGDKRIYDLVLFGFGSGLVVDELFSFVFTPDTAGFYFKPVSFYGALVFAGFSLIIFFLIYYEER